MSRSGDGCALAVITMLAIPAAIWANGEALVRLWAWFIAPTFDLHALSLGQALGVALTVGMFTGTTGDGKDREGAELAIHAWTMAIARPLFAVLFGHLYLMFM